MRPLIVSQAAGGREDGLVEPFGARSRRRIIEAQIRLASSLCGGMRETSRAVGRAAGAANCQTANCQAGSPCNEDPSKSYAQYLALSLSPTLKSAGVAAGEVLELHP
jgi:hypothetical protein